MIINWSNSCLKWSGVHWSTWVHWRNESKERNREDEWERNNSSSMHCVSVYFMCYSMALCSHIKKPLKEFKKQLVLLQVIFCVCKISLVEILCSEQMKIGIGIFLLKQFMKTHVNNQACFCLQQCFCNKTAVHIFVKSI